MKVVLLWIAAIILVTAFVCLLLHSVPIMLLFAAIIAWRVWAALSQKEKQ